VPNFAVLQKLGVVERAEMFITFNMGLGMTVVVEPADVRLALEVLKSRGLDAWDVGVIEAGTPGAEAEARVDP
jgi:phosphoribosylformylglycinamidine cyclo-ligase